MTSISDLAKQAAEELGWDAGFIERQWTLETAHFTSHVWLTDNNPAGIKWYPAMTYGTKGSAANDGGFYAHFDNPVDGYVNFVKHNPRYSNVADSKDPYIEAETIAKDGWATDPDYAKKIMSISIENSPVHAAVTPAPSPKPNYQSDNAYHVIQSGETLSGIALHYHVPMLILAKYNSIQNPNVIIAGKTLRIPVSYEVRSGDTVSELARRRNENASTIGYVNNLENINKIYVGQTLWV